MVSKNEMLFSLTHFRIAEAVNLCTDIKMIQVQPGRYTESTKKSKALFHVEVISPQMAVERALDAIEHGFPNDYLPGYLSLTDFILEHIALHDPIVCTEESQQDNLEKVRTTKFNC